MSDFDEFVSLYTRFRVAAQYNGHLWHRLEERVKVNGGVMPCHKILLLREVRSRIQDASNAEKSIDALIDEVIDQADRYRPPDTSGMVRHVVECPWLWVLKTRSGPKNAVSGVPGGICN